MQQTGETFDGSALSPLWQKLEQIQSLMEAADARYQASNVLSDRRFDSNDRPGLRLYIEASSLIGVARENHHMLLASMTGETGTVYPRATINLVRPSLEAALTAWWLLDPNDARERKIRGLRQSAEGHRQSVNAAGELLDHPDIELVTREEADKAHAEEARIAKVFRDDADMLGADWRKQISVTLNLRDEIANLSFIQGNPRLRQFMRYAWRIMSGVQHGLGYASVKVGERLDEVSIPGGVRATLVTNDSVLTNCCLASAYAQVMAMNLYMMRTESISRA